MNKIKIIFFLSAILLVSPLAAYSGIFPIEREAYFIQYLHPNGRGSKEVSIGAVTLGVSYLRSIRRLENPSKPFEGGLSLKAKSESIKVTVLETTFIEKNNHLSKRTFKPIDVHDYEMIHGRKQTIQFVDEYRDLPVIWTSKSGLSIHMDFPPIPEDIKEGEIYVKLKIESDEGVEFFEQSFPVYQKTFIGKKRIFD